MDGGRRHRHLDRRGQFFILIAGAVVALVVMTGALPEGWQHSLRWEYRREVSGSGLQ